MIYILFNKKTKHHIKIVFAKNRYHLNKLLKGYEFRFYKGNITAMCISHKRYRWYHITAKYQDYEDMTDGLVDMYIQARHRIEAIHNYYDYYKKPTMYVENFKCEEEKKPMVKTYQPYGAIAQQIIAYKFEKDGMFYVYDKAFNKYRISKEDYERLSVPLWNTQK